MPRPPPTFSAHPRRTREQDFSSTKRRSSGRGTETVAELWPQNEKRQLRDPMPMPVGAPRSSRRSQTWRKRFRDSRSPHST